MTVASIVVQNLLYLAGAVAGIVIGALVVTFRHRRPTSVEAHMASFHRGLRALAPDAPWGPARRAPTPPPAPFRPRSVLTVRPQPVEASVPAPGEARADDDDDAGLTMTPDSR